MKALLALACLVLAGCVGALSSDTKDSPRGTFFAEITRKQGAFSGAEKHRTGFGFYIEENDRAAGPTLIGYRYERGSRVRVIGGGSASREVVAALRAVGLRPFDFAAEVDACDARFQAAAKSRGEVYFAPYTVDGAEYDIVIATPSGEFSLKRWNPGPAINYYASYSADIAKVKRVLDLLAQYYGRVEFGV